MDFQDFELHQEVSKAITEKDYKKPTPIQEKAIPPLLAGRDLLGCAQTGTGKTAAFAIPILNRLARDVFDPDVYHPIKALVLAPTRELAMQIGVSFNTYGQFLDYHTGVVYGGVTPKRHIKVLKREPSVIVATPGRLLDLVERDVADLSQVEMLVLDEADRMLDLGMSEDVKRILALLPKVRQNMLFSATMPQSVKKLVNQILKNPIKIEIRESGQKKLPIIEQVYYIEEPDKTSLLMALLKAQSYESILVFTRTKKKADKVSKRINVANIKGIRSKAIHGDKNQSEREKVMTLFRQKEVQVLVATDVAARGIDIHDLSLVVNMDIPKSPEAYTHRIGRTGRAGKNGLAISFCSNQEMNDLKVIEHLRGHKLQVIKNHPYVPLNIRIKENRNKYKS